MDFKKYKLAVFDFDNTLINCNAYDSVKHLLDESKISNLRDIAKNHGWIARMNVLFKSNNINENKMKPLLNSIKIDDSMKNVLKFLYDNQYEIIIISDNNSVFINEILSNNDVLKYIHKVYTNSGNYESGYLRINGLNEEINKDKKIFECNLKPHKCEPNICKSCVLDYHIRNKCKNNNDRKRLKHVIYCGDGKNDYCPVYVLGENDVFCVRRGFALEKLLEDKELNDEIKATTVFWLDGSELIKKLSINIKENVVYSK